jgi:hypothetical protein
MQFQRGRVCANSWRGTERRSNASRYWKKPGTQFAREVAGELAVDVLLERWLPLLAWNEMPGVQLGLYTRITQATGYLLDRRLVDAVVTEEDEASRVHRLPAHQSFAAGCGDLVVGG